LLEALDGVTYLADRDGRVLAVGESAWRDFAAENDATDLGPEKVIGRSLFDMIEGVAVRDVAVRLHEAAWTLRRPRIVYDYRCDAPDEERSMRMNLSAVTPGGEPVAVLYQSQLITSAARVPVALFLRRNAINERLWQRPEHALHLCSYCQLVAWPLGTQGAAAEWIDPVDYYRRGGPPDVALSHGVCPSCLGRLLHEIREGDA
jgi:hypothetical protein